MNVYIGADHRGFALKKELLEWLKEEKFDVFDCGNTVLDPEDDYPDVGIAVGEKVSHDFDGMGIVICGSGAGVTVAANKVPMIRCAQAVTVEQVKNIRKDDDINILSIGSDLHTPKEIKTFIKAFLETPYKAEIRFDRRIQKLMVYEQSQSTGGGGCCGGGGCGDC